MSVVHSSRIHTQFNRPHSFYTFMIAIVHFTLSDIFRWLAVIWSRRFIASLTCHVSTLISKDTTRNLLVYAFMVQNSTLNFLNTFLNKSRCEKVTIGLFVLATDSWISARLIYQIRIRFSIPIPFRFLKKWIYFKVDSERLNWIRFSYRTFTKFRFRFM